MGPKVTLQYELLHVSYGPKFPRVGIPLTHFYQWKIVRILGVLSSILYFRRNQTEQSELYKNLDFKNTLLNDQDDVNTLLVWF